LLKVTNISAVNASQPGRYLTYNRAGVLIRGSTLEGRGRQLHSLEALFGHDLVTEQVLKLCYLQQGTCGLMHKLWLMPPV